MKGCQLQPERKESDSLMGCQYLQPERKESGCLKGCKYLLVSLPIMAENGLKRVNIVKRDVCAMYSSIRTPERAGWFYPHR